jgi:hypothetical protein
MLLFMGASSAFLLYLNALSQGSSNFILEVQNLANLKKLRFVEPRDRS